MNKKALPALVVVAVVAVLVLIFSITRSFSGGTDLPMPTKPHLADAARQHILQRGNPAARMGMPSGSAAGGQ